MHARAKIATVILLIIIVALAVWQFSSPPQLPPVGNKYTSQSAYTTRGIWTILESMSYGRAFLAFSIANQTQPSTTFQTGYVLVVSNVNQTVTSSYVKGFALRVTAITLQDNYDGSSSKWGVGPSLVDAIMATATFSFQTSAVHQLRLTVNYQLYDLLPLGSIADKTLTSSFNITQTVV